MPEKLVALALTFAFHATTTATAIAIAIVGALNLGADRGRPSVAGRIFSGPGGPGATKANEQDGIAMKFSTKLSTTVTLLGMESSVNATTVTVMLGTGVSGCGDSLTAAVIVALYDENAAGS